jgi:hypothetical protein
VTLPATETPEKPQIAEAVLNQRLGLECFARSGLPPERVLLEVWLARAEGGRFRCRGRGTGLSVGPERVEWPGLA